MRILPYVSFAVLLLGLGMKKLPQSQEERLPDVSPTLWGFNFLVYALTWTLMSSLWNQYGSRGKTGPRGQEVAR